MDYFTFLPLAPTGAERAHLYDAHKKAMKALATARFRYASRAEATRNFTVFVEPSYSTPSNVNKIPSSSKATLRTLHKRQCSAIVAVDKAKAYVDQLDRLMADLFARDRAWESWCTVWQQKQMNVMHPRAPMPMDVPVQMRMPTFVQKPFGYYAIFTADALGDIGSCQRATFYHDLDKGWRTHSTSANTTTGPAFFLPPLKNRCHSDAASYAEGTSVHRTNSHSDESDSFIDERTLKVVQRDINDSPLDVSRHIFSHEILHNLHQSAGNSSSRPGPYLNSRLRGNSRDHAETFEATDVEKPLKATGNLECFDRCEREKGEESGKRYHEMEDFDVHARLGRLNKVSQFKLRRCYSLGAERWVM